MPKEQVSLSCLCQLYPLTEIQADGSWEAGCNQVTRILATSLMGGFKDRKNVGAKQTMGKYCLLPLTPNPKAGDK